MAFQSRDFNSTDDECDCGPCVDLRANAAGVGRSHHTNNYDDDDDDDAYSRFLDYTHGRYCPPDQRRRWRQQAFAETLMGADADAAEPLIYELRSLRQEIAGLSDLLFSAMLDNAFADECDEDDYQMTTVDSSSDLSRCDSLDSQTWYQYCPGCASKELVNRKGKEKEVLPQEEPEELIVPTVVYEEGSENKEKETVAAKSESESSEDLGSSA
ncbi:hypothetical protein PG994_003929 [Apiospora phragmitis]|uniref:Uncharacterized protein n=1 Tax=Apiospora phragmitis TaxID=2905665 RepID=A0ABR1W0S7_9PEZI